MSGTIALRRLADMNPPSPHFEVLPDDASVLFLPLETVWADDRADQSRRVPKVQVASGYSRFQTGDVVSPKVTPTFQAGRSMLASGVGAGTTELHVLRAKPGVDPRWVLYAVRSKHFLEEGVTAFEGVAGLQRVPGEFLQEFRIADISQDEQRRIADFLDERVARIDQIIGARRSQVGLVESAFRAHLDTIAAPKAQSRLLKSLLVNVTSGPRGWGDLVSDEGTPFVRIANLRPLGIELSERNLAVVNPPTDAEGERASLKPGDVLLSITAVFGEVAVWRHGPGTFSQHVARLRPMDRADSDWIAWILQSSPLHDQYTLSGYGGTKVGMGLDQVRNLRVPDVPPAARREQAVHLTRRWCKVRSLRSGLEQSVDSLREYKQSLITAAVTGELDVTTASTRIPGE